MRSITVLLILLLVFSEQPAVAEPAVTSNSIAAFCIKALSSFRASADRETVEEFSNWARSLTFDQHGNLVLPPRSFPAAAFEPPRLRGERVALSSLDSRERRIIRNILSRSSGERNVSENMTILIDLTDGTTVGANVTSSRPDEVNGNHIARAIFGAIPVSQQGSVTRIRLFHNHPEQSSTSIRVSMDDQRLAQELSHIFTELGNRHSSPVEVRITAVPQEQNPTHVSQVTALNFPRLILARSSHGPVLPPLPSARSSAIERRFQDIITRLQLAHEALRSGSGSSQQAILSTSQSIVREARTLLSSLGVATESTTSRDGFPGLRILPSNTSAEIDGLAMELGQQHHGLGLNYFPHLMIENINFSGQYDTERHQISVGTDSLVRGASQLSPFLASQIANAQVFGQVITGEPSILAGFLGSRPAGSDAPFSPSFQLSSAYSNLAEAKRLLEDTQEQIAFATPSVATNFISLGRTELLESARASATDLSRAIPAIERITAALTGHRARTEIGTVPIPSADGSGRFYFVLRVAVGNDFMEVPIASYDEAMRIMSGEMSRRSAQRQLTQDEITQIALAEFSPIAVARLQSLVPILNRERDRMRAMVAAIESQPSLNEALMRQILTTQVIPGYTELANLSTARPH